MICSYPGKEQDFCPAAQGGESLIGSLAPEKDS
jgi:hypothetical protein